MSSRPLLQPMPVIVDGDLATPLTSLVTIISNQSMMSYEYVWTGASPVASVDVQVSNDYSQNADGTVRNTGNWASLPLSTSPSVTGNTGVGVVDIDQLGAYAIRTVITPISGTGTINVTYKGKVA